eukprot:154939-Amorphochlora_amoeboformis.AAC.1
MSRRAIEREDGRIDKKQTGRRARERTRKEKNERRKEEIRSLGQTNQENITRLEHGTYPDTLGGILRNTYEKIPHPQNERSTDNSSTWRLP